MYIAAGQGQTTLGDKILMSTETSCHFGHLLQVSKKSLWSLILYNVFHDFIHVYSPGAGADNPRGQNFEVNRNILSLWSFVAKFKKHLSEVWFYTIFFMILYMYIAPGQEQTAPRGQSFDVNRHVLSLHSFVASFKKCLWRLILCNFFHDLIHVYSPGQGQTAPEGQNFDVNRKALSLYPFFASFKEISLKSDFIQIFHD